MGKDIYLMERQPFSGEFHLSNRRSIYGVGNSLSLSLSLSLRGDRLLRPPLDPPLPDTINGLIGIDSDNYSLLR